MPFKTRGHPMNFPCHSLSTWFPMPSPAQPMAPFWVTGQEHSGILCSYLCFQKWFKSSQHSFSTGTFYEMSSWQMSVELGFTTLLIKGPKVLPERPEQQVWFLLGQLAKEGPNYCCVRPLLACRPAHSSIRGRGRGFRPDWAINALLFPKARVTRTISWPAVETEKKHFLFLTWPSAHSPAPKQHHFIYKKLFLPFFA